MKNGTATKLASFMKTIAIELVAVPAGAVPRIPAAAAAEPLRHRSGDHFSIRLPPTQFKPKPTMVCALCLKKRDASGRAVRREMSWRCKESDVALCVECMLLYRRPRAAEHPR